MITGADLRKAREGQRVSLARLAQMIGRDKGHRPNAACPPTLQILPEDFGELTFSFRFAYTLVAACLNI